MHRHAEGRDDDGRRENRSRGPRRAPGERELREPRARRDRQEVDDGPQIELVALEHAEDRERTIPLAAGVSRQHAQRHDEDAEQQPDGPRGRRIDGAGPAWKPPRRGPAAATGMSARARAQSARSNATDAAARTPPAAIGAQRARAIRAICAVTTSQVVATRHASGANAAVRDRASTGSDRASAMRSEGASGRSGSRKIDAAATARPTPSGDGRQDAQLGEHHRDETTALATRTREAASSAPPPARRRAPRRPRPPARAELWKQGVPRRGRRLELSLGSS